MPTDAASPAVPGLAIANTRVLRLAFGTALSLWISQAGIAQGLSATQAQGRAGIEFTLCHHENAAGFMG